MSRIEDLIELEGALRPELLEQMAEQEPIELFDTQRSVQELTMQKLNQLQSNCEQIDYNKEHESKEKLQKASKRIKNRKSRWVIAAICCAILVSVSTAAIGMLSTDERLLQLLHADSQSQIAQINEMSCKIGAVATADGYAVTIQEAIHDRHHVWLLLELEGPENVALDTDQIFFRDIKLEFERMSAYGYTMYALPDENWQDNKVSMIMDISVRTVIAGQKILLNFEELGINTYLEETMETSCQWTSLAQGPWQFEFKLPKNDTTVSVWQWKVLQSDDKTFLLKKAEISPLSIMLSMRRMQWDMYLKLREEPVQIYFKDGQMLELESGSSGSGGLNMQFQYTMPSPIELEEIDYILYCGERLNW